MSVRLVLKNVRLSYAHVWEPQPAREADRDPKYTTSIIIPKSDTEQIKKIEAAIEKLPLRDGDTERDDEAYRDSMFLSASSKTRPGIVDQNVEPILDRDEIYSGVYVNISIDFYAFNVKTNRGIACGLGNIQKVRDGEALGGGAIKAESEFAVVDDGASDFLA